MSNYSTNLTDNQWKVIEIFFDCKRKRKNSIRNIVNALLYMVKTGVQWRSLPNDFPKWQLVYYYFGKWSAEGLYGRGARIFGICRKPDFQWFIFFFQHRQPRFSKQNQQLFQTYLFRQAADVFISSEKQRTVFFLKRSRSRVTIRFFGGL